MSTSRQLQKQQQGKSMRKPKLAPAKIINSHHISYLNDKAREQELSDNSSSVLTSASTRPISVPGNILLTNDSEPNQTPDNRADIRAESILPSRPSTQTTIRDGIILRWESEERPLLRRPRTSSDHVIPKRNSAKMSRARFGVAMTRTKAKMITKSLTQAAIDRKQEQSAAQLCLDQSRNPDNPFTQNKSRMIRQYHLWNGDNMDRLDLPIINFSSSNSGGVTRPYNVALSDVPDRAIKQLKFPRSSSNMADSYIISASRSSHVFSKAASTILPRRLCLRTLTERFEIPILEQLRYAMKGLL